MLSRLPPPPASVTSCVDLCKTGSGPSHHCSSHPSLRFLASQYSINPYTCSTSLQMCVPQQMQMHWHNCCQTKCCTCSQQGGLAGLFVSRCSSKFTDLKLCWPFALVCLIDMVQIDHSIESYH